MADEGQEKPVEHTSDAQAPEETVVATEAPEVPEPQETTPPAADEAVVMGLPKDKKARRKKILKWTALIVVLLGVLGVLAWQLKWYLPLFNRIYAASVTFKVREDDTFALQEARVTFKEQTYTTDASGQVTIPQTVAGDWTVLVAKEGYESVESAVTLKKGDNGTISLSMKREPEKLLGYKGLVTDFVSGGAVSGAQVSLSGQTTTTDAAGAFEVTKLAAGDYKITISKTGFNTIEIPITVDATSGETAVAHKLVPAGRVLFVSNRDGKRALYFAAYNGESQQQLVAPADGTEDFGPVVSPDGKYVVFSSTRDKVADTYNAGFVPRLYIVGIDGKNLKKIADDVSPAVLKWSGNSKYIYFEAYQDSKLTTYTRRFYDLAKGSTFDLGDTSSKVTFSTSGVHAFFAVARTLADGTTIVHDIKTLDLVTGARRTIVEGVADFMTTELMTISADDKTITYQTQGTSGRKRYQVAFLGGTPAEIALPTEAARTYFISPDGALKAFIDTRDGKKDLFVVDSNGANEQRLTTLGLVSDTAPVGFDETSKYLTFALVKEGESAMYIVSSTGGQVQKIVDFTPDSQPIPYY